MNKVLVLMMLPLLLLAAEWQSLNGPPAGRADDMSIGYHEGSQEWHIYAADRTHKLYKSTNEGEHWDSLTYFEVTKNPICVITRPTDAQVVYIGKNDATPVWWSQNGGQTWVERSGTYPNDISNEEPKCFAMDPNDADIIYLGCAKDNANPDLFKTTNAGEDWSSLSNLPNVAVNDMAITHDPLRGTWILAGCSGTEDRGIWLSTNGGNDWNQKLSDVDIYSIEFATQFIGYAGAASGVYKTENGGVTWTPLGSSPAFQINDLLAINTLVVYAATNDTMHMTTNGGASWDRINTAYRCEKALSLLVHPQDNQTIFSSADWCIYKTTNAGAEWSEITDGYHPAKLVDVTTNSPTIYALGLTICGASKTSVFCSSDAGNNWTTMSGSFSYPPNDDIRPLAISVSPINTDLVLLGGQTITADPESENKLNLFRSIDGSKTWQQVHYTSEGDLNSTMAIGFCPIKSDTVFVTFSGLVDYETVIRSINEGGDWVEKDIPANDALSLGVAPQYDDTLYVGSMIYGVYKSTNAGDNWTQTSLNNVDVNALAIDFDYPDTLYAGSDNCNGIYKTNSGGNAWDKKNNGLDYLYITDLEIDADEPTIVYALCKEYESASETYVYCTVDRAGKWFDISDGLPTDKPTRDLEIDRDEPDPVYAATEQGVYTYTPDFNKSLVSSSKDASAFNNGRNMIRIEDSYEFWVTYESGGVIYVVRSTNAGLSWSKKMEVGQGCNPAISIRTGIPDVPPCVVWLAKDQEESQDVIFFARHISGQKWTAPAQIKISQYGVDFGPPSFVIDNSNYGHLVYADGSSVKYTKFNIYDPNPTTSETVGDGEDPCIGFMTGSTEPPIHVVWEDDAAIKYRARTVFGWASIDNISSSNSHHPSLEIGGNNVYLVWENDRSIYWCYATYTGSSHSWSRYLRVDDTSDPSIYPTLTSGYACAWVDEVTGNYEEVYLSYYDPEQGEWVVPINISTDSDELYSNYPHIVHRQVPNVATTIYFIWTEGSETVIQPTAPPYDIIFENYVIWETDAGQSEALPFYVADGGEENASPFNLRRDGYHQYGVEPYKRVDYDEQYLKYQFANLNPKRLYELGAYLYQHGYSNLHISAMVDNYQIGAIVLPADTLVILRHMLPTTLYEDSTINITIFGNNAVSAILVLSEFEPDNKGGGPQGTEGLSGMPDCFALHAYPCPASNVFFMEYAVPVAGVVHVTLYDVAGRSVQEICNTYCEPGIYQKRVDLEGIAQGVYFLRLESNKEVVTKKVIMLQ